MSIEARKRWIFVENVTEYPVLGSDLSFHVDEEKLDEYLEDHPFPEDSLYSEEDLRADLNGFEGIYYLLEESSAETATYVAGLLNEILY